MQVDAVIEAMCEAQIWIIWPNGKITWCVPRPDPHEAAKCIAAELSKPATQAEPEPLIVTLAEPERFKPPSREWLERMAKS